MKIASIAYPDDEPRVAAVEDGSLRLLPCETLDELLEAGDRPHALGFGPRVDLPPAGLRAPLRPRKIVAIGLNYLDHIRESGADVPTAPLIFAKFPTAVVGPGDPIVLDPAVAKRVDWEVELAVVIGRRMVRVSPEQALDGVFGYTVANDVSARDVQFGDGQWVRGKSHDTFCPLGPYVVTPDEIPDPQALRLTTKVNGELVQDSTTAEMVFGVGEVLSYCSRSFTLEPGDVVITGTPWGCGEFMDPRRSLRPGDEVELEIERIGVLRNPVVEAPGGRWQE